jgi:hypothetical protein
MVTVFGPGEESGLMSASISKPGEQRMMQFVVERPCPHVDYQGDLDTSYLPLVLWVEVPPEPKREHVCQVATHVYKIASESYGELAAQGFSGFDPKTNIYLCVCPHEGHLIE